MHRIQCPVVGGGGGGGLSPLSVEVGALHFQPPLINTLLTSYIQANKQTDEIYLNNRPR